MCNGCHDPGMHVTLSTNNQPQETHCALSVFGVCVCVYKLMSVLWVSGSGGTKIQVDVRALP